MSNTLNSWIQPVALTPPSLNDNTADVDRLINALKPITGADSLHVDLYLIKALPGIMRASDFRLRCILFHDGRQWILTGATPADDPAPVIGMAIDLGTTQVVLRMLDLVDGGIIAETHFDNPQLSVGPDILSRIHFTDQENGLERLNTLITEGLNRSILELCRANRISPENIYLLSVAGNTAMTHLFLGLEPGWMIREPYIPVINRIGSFSAEYVGIKANPSARVYVFPNIGSYFGGDLIAGVLHSKLHLKEETSILVDVGTNAEVVIGNHNWLAACAGAAGPALEGGVTRMGMMAKPGVIDRVRIDPDTRELTYHTIGDLPPKGICGSGLIDLAAQLFLADMIDIQGKYIHAHCGRRLTSKNGIPSLIVEWAESSGTGLDLFLSQTDLDSLIRSKAAMYTILETITASVGITPSDLSHFFVAGTFGSFIDPDSAITLGMLPDLPRNRFKSLGNSSLEGATLILQSPSHMQTVDNIRDAITYIELNVNQEFMNRFSAARFLPHTDRSRFPSVRLGAL
jgi:uncharacterized 2Fe-2S/4Fe-4S cluster protein (DUF4445 family)